jgi:hypothetical protein
MLTYKWAHTHRETHAARAGHINILWLACLGRYNILWFTPLTNCSEFHLYYDIWTASRVRLICGWGGSADALTMPAMLVPMFLRIDI